MTNTMSGQHVTIRGWAATLIATAATAALLVVAPSTNVDAAAYRVTICHQAGNLSYRVITVDANSILHGGGHGHHEGDIIPAFNGSQGNKPLHYGGQNLGVVRASDQLTGAHILAAGCSVPASTTTAQLTPPTSAAIATPTPVDTLPPTPTTEATPPTTQTPVPTTGAQTTLAPNTTTQATPPTTQTPAPTTGAQTTLAPNTTTAAANCPDGELAHDGECFAVPPLVLPPTPTLATITSQPESASLTPIVECVHNRSDGVRVVWFSYESTADSAVVVERGPANQISPRGTPPTLFGPGVHVFVIAVETADGIASWTLAGETATSNEQSRDCESTLTTDTTSPGITDTTAPSTNEPGTTGTTEPGTTGTTEPGTTGTTEPGTTGTTEPGAGQPSTGASTSSGACATGETETDGACVPVEPLRLVLVDNVLECDGHAVARFAAFNDNVFALESGNATSLVSPQRLAADAPKVINERSVASDDGSETAALFTVRYVTAVTWTVAHHGLEASISAGVNGATANPDCPEALVESAGAHGLLFAGGPLATTGPDDSLPLAVVATLISALGLGLVMVARRRPRTVH